MDGGLHQAAHFQQFVIQLFKFNGEMTHRGSPSISGFRPFDFSAPRPI
jgi:hypothetical protein